MKRLDSLLKSLALAENYEEAASVLYQVSELISGFRPKDRHRPFRYGSYQFEVCLSTDFAKLQSALKRCAELEIDSAPSLIAAIQFKNGEGCIVTQIPELEEAELISCEDSATEISSTAFEGLVKDLEVLKVAGLFHPYATKGYAHWYLHPGKAQIYLDRWEMLRPIEPRESERLSEEINLLILSG